MTPQDILAATEDQLRVWCALLDGWPTTIMEHALIDLPEYTTSLDASWNLQAATIEKCSWGTYAERLLDVAGWTLKRIREWDDSRATPHNSNFEGYRIFGAAPAIARARAICLTRLQELEELTR